MWHSRPGCAEESLLRHRVKATDISSKRTGFAGFFFSIKAFLCALCETFVSSVVAAAFREGRHGPDLYILFMNLLRPFYTSPDSLKLYGSAFSGISA